MSLFLLSSSAKVYWHPTGKLAPPAVYRDKQTANVPITLVEGTAHIISYSQNVCYIRMETLTEPAQ